MARVACLVMLKNERVLTQRFLRYHAALFGAENIYVFDNGSSDKEVLTELDRFEAAGGHVDRGCTTSEDYHRKATILGDLIKRLDREAEYDFYIPLDCDEFVVLRTPGGYTADPRPIHDHLDGLRSERNILHVTLNLSNLLGSPDHFRAAAYSKTVYPRGVFRLMDQGYHTGKTRDGNSVYVACDLVYAHFHYRPYEEVLEFARQKLRNRMSEAQLADHQWLRSYRGLGSHMVAYIVDGPEAYYRQFRDCPAPVVFPELGARFKEIGTSAPFAEFRLPPPVAVKPRSVHLIIDECSAARVRGWAMDIAAPLQPISLRFLLDGTVAHEAVCDQPRPDVRKAGQPTDRVGFDFVPPPRLSSCRTPQLLTVEDDTGMALRMSICRKGCDAIALAAIAEPPDPKLPIYSHIDSFVGGRVQGWVLRTVATPEQNRLLGCCTVVLAHAGRIISQTVADIVRDDVAKAMHGEARCGFQIEVPRSLLSQDHNPIVRLFIMPEQRELAGSPCVIAGMQAA